MRIVGTMSSIGFCALLAACGGNDAVNLQPPPPSSPMTWALQAGTSSAQEALQGLNFYPAALTIDAGDTVVWTYPTGEPHTVTVVPAGKPIPPPNDPNAALPAGGTSVDGTAFTSSGFKLLGDSYALKFPTPGTYVYHCLIHPGMVGTIVVNPAGTRYPTLQADATALGRGSAGADLAAATASVATFPYAGGGTHIAVGISPPLANGQPSSATVLRYLDGPALSDQPLGITVGTTLTWTNLSNKEPHTVSIAPAGQAFPAVPPPGAPTGNTTFDGTKFSNSGNIFPGASYSLTFTAPGTYVVHCIYHDDTEHMVETIVVH